VSWFSNSGTTSPLHVSQTHKTHKTRSTNEKFNASQHSIQNGCVDAPSTSPSPLFFHSSCTPPDLDASQFLLRLNQTPFSDIFTSAWIADYLAHEGLRLGRELAAGADRRAVFVEKEWKGHVCESKECGD
jgi:hypothetical protein